MQAGAEQKVENEVKMQEVWFHCFSATDREEQPQIWAIRLFIRAKHLLNDRPRSCGRFSLSWILTIPFLCLQFLLLFFLFYIPFIRICTA